MIAPASIFAACQNVSPSSNNDVRRTFDCPKVLIQTFPRLFAMNSRIIA